MRRLAGQAHRLVQHHGVVQVLRQAGQGSPDGTCMGCWNRGAPRHAPSSSRSISCCHHRWRRVLRPPALMPARQAALDGCSARPALLKGRCNTATGPQSGAWRPRPTLWTRPRGTTSRLPARGAASCGAVCTGRLAKCVRVRGAPLAVQTHNCAPRQRQRTPRTRPVCSPPALPTTWPGLQLGRICHNLRTCMHNAASAETRCSRCSTSQQHARRARDECAVRITLTFVRLRAQPSCGQPRRPRRTGRRAEERAPAQAEPRATSARSSGHRPRSHRPQTLSASRTTPGV